MLHEKLAGVPIDASYNNNPPHHGSHGDLYYFKRESLSVQAIPWARPSSAVQGFLTVGKSVMETSIISHKAIYRIAIKYLLLAGKFSFHVNVVFDQAINRTQTDRSSVNPSTWPRTKKRFSITGKIIFLDQCCGLCSSYRIYSLKEK